MTDFYADLQVRTGTGISSAWSRRQFLLSSAAVTTLPVLGYFSARLVMRDGWVLKAEDI